MICGECFGGAPATCASVPLRSKSISMEGLRCQLDLQTSDEREVREYPRGEGSGTYVSLVLLSMISRNTGRRFW